MVALLGRLVASHGGSAAVIVVQATGFLISIVTSAAIFHWL